MPEQATHPILAKVIWEIDRSGYMDWLESVGRAKPVGRGENKRKRGSFFYRLLIRAVVGASATEEC